ncbi:armadillo-type protein [Pilobolus umbonatus]|nr:armadillo-type protein [Pilobolus umbonatus]
MSTESISRVLEALSSLYSGTDRQTTKEANRWLESFQKKPEAWAVADYLLKAKDSNKGVCLFAAQTLKQKIVYDLRDLDDNARLQLRDSLVELIYDSPRDSKAVVTQLCLALADLAIQILPWKTVVADIVDKFGKTPENAIYLLEILKVLPEEVDSNLRIPLADEEYKMRSKELIEQNAEEVYNLLTLFMQTPGDNIEFRERTFKCLSSWIKVGAITGRMLSNGPMLQLAFDGLTSDDLFDVAVDVVSEIIYETRDVAENQSTIEKIYPYFTAILPKLREAIKENDEDAVRGYSRIFAEAGEAYVILIATHPEAFKTLLEGILECTAYHDLEIVPVTFKFWFELTNILETEKYMGAIPQLAHYYDNLVDIMIGHLHYPPDVDEMTAEERDDFRDFRHKMGDTLKDCCRILSPQRCLTKPMNLLANLLNHPESTWQQLEAPIFSLRAMGSTVPADENTVMPHIMEFLSKLPDHPKIRYAATLVISTYSFWTESHPQFITYQLNFISSGFQNNEVAAASALALKNLCKDCSAHLVDYISQLHIFYLNVVKSLPYRDVIEVTEAVSHVINVLPLTEVQKALELFCLPVVQDLHNLVIKGKEGTTKDERTHIGDLLEQIGVFFYFIHPKNSDNQGHPCITIISEIWPVLELTLTNFSDVMTICDPLCKCFNNFIKSYDPYFIPLLPRLMDLLVKSFELTGLSVYLWVSLKVIRKYAKDEGEGAAACSQLVQRLSQAVFIKMQGQQVSDMPDVIEEYFLLVGSYLERAPTLCIQDPSLSIVFQAGLSALSITEPHALQSVLDFYHKLLRTVNYVPRLRSLFEEQGRNLTAVLFNGLIDFYTYDSIFDVVPLFQSMAEHLHEHTLRWMLSVLNDIPEEYMSVGLKNEFMTNWTK